MTQHHVSSSSCQALQRVLRMFGVRELGAQTRLGSIRRLFERSNCRAFPDGRTYPFAPPDDASCRQHPKGRELWKGGRMRIALVGSFNM